MEENSKKVSGFRHAPSNCNDQMAQQWTKQEAASYEKLDTPAHFRGDAPTVHSLTWSHFLLNPNQRDVPCPPNRLVLPASTRSAEGADPPAFPVRGDRSPRLQQTLPRSSEPLAVEFIQAIRQLLRLLKCFAALLPTFGYLFLPIISPCDGSRHGSDGVCVSTQRDAVDDGPLQVVVVLRNVWVSVHTAQEGVDGSRDRAQSSNAIACNRTTSFSAAGCSVLPSCRSTFFPLTGCKHLHLRRGISPVLLAPWRLTPSYPSTVWQCPPTRAHPTRRSGSH